ncbi:MAG TPA: PRC-barrel domain-containing protein [Gaiellaceae bacterium]|nr:PRC-barrel domain-containing protein [Gaiellaceae bacterium]
MSRIDLALGILDHQLIDSQGRRCGKVDDLELDGLDVKAIVSGRSGWAGRGRLGRLTAWLARGPRAVLVPWDEVRAVDDAVRLRKTAGELRLGRGDDRARQLVERIPGSGL